jgi:hypothetical protein
MPNAIRFHKSGGPEVLVSEPVPIGKPGPGEARVRHTAVGVNFVDIYIRTGLYPAALPSGLGTEAAGVVEDVGPGVGHVKAGDRVAYAGGPLGAYSEVRVMPADRLVALPQGISDQQAAAMMLKGLGSTVLTVLPKQLPMRPDWRVVPSPKRHTREARCHAFSWPRSTVTARYRIVIYVSMIMLDDIADFDGFLVAYEYRKQNRTGDWVDGRRGSARSASTGRSRRARPNPWARSHAKRAIAQGNSSRPPRLGSLLTRRFFLARRGASPRPHRPPGM